MPIGSTVMRVAVTWPGPYWPAGKPSPVISIVNWPVKVWPSAPTSPVARIVCIGAESSPLGTNAKNVRFSELGPVASHDPMPTRAVGVGLLVGAVGVESDERWRVVRKLGHRELPRTDDGMNRSRR